MWEINWVVVVEESNTSIVWRVHVRLSRVEAKCQFLLYGVCVVVHVMCIFGVYVWLFTCVRIMYLYVMSMHVYENVFSKRQKPITNRTPTPTSHSRPDTHQRTQTIHIHYSCTLRSRTLKIIQNWELVFKILVIVLI